MKDYEQIAEHINLALDINIFENKRTMEVVDGRSLFCYILNKDLKKTLYGIKDIFKENGKNFDHSSVYYNINLYDEVKSRRPKMDLLRDEVLGGVKPKYKLIRMIEKIHNENEIAEITTFIKKNYGI